MRDAADAPAHIPAPAEHAPRKVAVQQGDGDLLVRERASSRAWILCLEGTAEVRR